MAFDSRSGSREPTGHEFLDCLERAESLLDRVDRARAEGARVRLLGAVGPLVSLPVIVAVSLVPQFDPVRFIATAAVWVVAAAIAIWLSARSPRDGSEDRIPRDETAMVEIVAMLRDVLPTVAQSERWPYVYQRTVESRLARFPIGLSRR